MRRRRREPTDVGWVSLKRKGKRARMRALPGAEGVAYVTLMTCRNL